MKRLMVGMVAAVALMASAEGTSRALDDGTGLPPIHPRSIRWLGSETTVAFQKTYICDEMRDYYYNAETGEFIGWAGDPYLANCVEVGSNDPSDQCDPGDHACICQTDPSASGCRDCKPGQECPEPPPPPPRRPKTCAKCQEDLAKQAEAVAAKVASCSFNWGRQTAVANCRHGMTRCRAGQPHCTSDSTGYDAGLDNFINGFNHGNTAVCLPHYGTNIPVCIVIPEFQQCVDDWMTGSHQETVTTPGDTFGASITVSRDSWPVAGGGEYTHTMPGSETVLPANQGFVDKCYQAYATEREKTLTNFKWCQAKAPDRTPGSHVCPPPVMTPVGPRR